MCFMRQVGYLFLLLPTLASADSFYCGGYLVNTGDSQSRVLDICGEPQSARQDGFIEQVVPADQREHTSATLIRILNGSLFELYEMTRAQAGLPEVKGNQPEVQAFMTRSVLALSDSMLYPVPVVLALDSFDQKQASVFQVTRTPGRNVVYLGCIWLIIGVFAMLYIRERRLWIWLQDDGQGGTRVRMALSATRQTLDTDHEFDKLRQATLGATDAPQAAA